MTIFKRLILLFVLYIAVVQKVDAQKDFKIITYNIWNGFDWGKNSGKENRFVNWVKKQNCDVIALQELCSFTQSKLQSLAKKWGHNYALILKESGYPVGITSKYPIKLKGKILKNMHHGAMHCEIKGIDFFVVHLSPFDCQKRLAELNNLESTITDVKHSVVLGDFNSLSPLDFRLHQKNNALSQYNKIDINKNLFNKKIDYAVISKMMSIPMYDACINFIESEDVGSYPSIELYKGQKLSVEEIKLKQSRIDYIFLSKELFPKLKSARVIHSDFTNSLSDHYPVEAIINLN